jgi:hypothetical protein
MFLLYHSKGCNTCGAMFCKCYLNDLHTTTCSGMLGHRSSLGRKRVEDGLQMYLFLVHLCQHEKKVHGQLG